MRQLPKADDSKEGSKDDVLCEGCVVVREVMVRVKKAGFFLVLFGPSAALLGLPRNDLRSRVVGSNLTTRGGVSGLSVYCKNSVAKGLGGVD